MICTSEQKDIPTEISRSNDRSSKEICRICAKPVENVTFAPFCSFKCSKLGVKRRYELLRTFIGFESNYINPSKSIEPVVVASVADEEKTVEVPEKPKKIQRLPRAEYTQFVPAVEARQKSRGLLIEALRKPLKTELNLSKLNYGDIACRIEQALYNLLPFSINFSLKSDYNSKLRDLLFNLSDPNNADLRNTLFSNEVEPERLPLMSADELASSDMRKWREEEERKHLEENVLLPPTAEELEKKAKKAIIDSTNSAQSNSTASQQSVVVIDESASEVSTAVNTDTKAQREREINALLDAIPIPTAEPIIEKEDIMEEKIENNGDSLSPDLMTLPLTANSETDVAVAMPEGKPIHFHANVISSPDDVEIPVVQLDTVLHVLGRMGVTICESFLQSRCDHAGYDVIWWALEMSEKSSENDLQKLLQNFIPEKRVGVLETGLKDKTLYFVPPALDPVSSTPTSTLSFVSDGCYKQFCHLVFVRKRGFPREHKDLQNVPQVIPQITASPPADIVIPKPTTFIPRSPQSSPPSTAYGNPSPNVFPPQTPPQARPQGYPPVRPDSNYVGYNQPRGIPRSPYPPRSDMSYPPRGDAPPYPPRSNMPYPPRGDAPPYPPRSNMPYPPRGDMPPYPPRSNMPYPPRGNMPPYPPRSNMSYPPRGEGRPYPRGDPLSTPRQPWPRQSYPPRGEPYYGANGPAPYPPREYPPRGYAPRPRQEAPSKSRSRWDER